MRLSNLPEHLRSWGLTVVEVPGWETRGKPFDSSPHVVVAHHTGTPRSRTKDYPTLAIVRDGRSDLPGPLCQVGLGYSGTVYVVASGKANHAGQGHWAGHVVGNSDSVGIEAESPGDGSWTGIQRVTYPLLCAALCDLLGSPASLVCGHRESAEPHGRKVDPTGIDLNKLRADTAAHLKAGPPRKPAPQPSPKPVPTSQEDDMRVITCTGHVPRLLENGKAIGLTPQLVEDYKAAGVPVVAMTDGAAFVRIVDSRS